MANFAAVRSLHVSQVLGFHFFKFQFSLWAKSWYNTSAPVKYVPGIFSQNKKNKDSPPLESSWMKNCSLVQNEVPMLGNSASGLSSFDDCPLQSTHADEIGPRNISEQIGELSDFDNATEIEDELLFADKENKCELYVNSATSCYESIEVRQEVKKLAVELLATRAFTAVELQKKLRGKKYPLHIVQSIVDDFKSRGLLNDALYAESFTRLRWLSSTWGPGKIKHALIHKGVSEAEAEKARQQVFEEDDPEGGDQNRQYGMSKLSIDHLFLQASKQWWKSRNAPLDNRRARMVRWLKYRGFNWGVTNYILKKLESLDPP
ncbi:hypothetical protein AXF42_Ash014712 [Apostasia shenzhenica]|uniref:Regulatory protein RecX n=1 Tax=Apostasia shenzhenica TaxID=1088818 RepID=A0A2H9ZW72_9ASPA|nr:hypothetical protein AXF42_Ash014712 [Apostasia shenzhenica]